VKITLFTGDGWAPFTRDPGEELAWKSPNPDEYDVPASIDKLAQVFGAKVHDVYPNAEINELPESDGDGHLVKVKIEPGDVESADEALALTADDLEADGFAPALMIEGEIAGLLDGIIRDRPHTWRVNT